MEYKIGGFPMKRHIAIILSALLLSAMTGCGQSGKPVPSASTAAGMQQSTGCGQSDSLVPLEELPEDYSLEQAKKDGCITHEDGDITQGIERFEEFYDTTKSGKADKVRTADYYSPDDPSGYDPESYDALKAGYPCLYVHDLSFDGEQYTIRWYEDGEEIVRNYSCLMKYEGPAESSNAVYKSYTRYVLTNDDEVTWQELVQGMTSSQLGDYIEHMSVCTDYVYASDAP